MEKTNTVLDREKLSADYIQSKQNFNHVLFKYKKSSPQVLKSPWFYGPVGLATIGAVVAFSSSSIEPPGPSSVKQNSTIGITAEVKRVHKLDSKIDVKSGISNVASVTNKSPKNTDKPNFSPVEKTKIILTETVDNPVNTPTPKSQPISARRKVQLPNIGGYFTGEIPLSILCNNQGILCGGEIEITSFQIQYFDGKKEVELSVDGNKIPENIYTTLQKYNLNGMIFITDIRAINKVNGRTEFLSSMNLIPTQKKSEYLFDEY